MAIPIQEHDLPDNRDLLFELTSHADGIVVYPHIVDCHVAAVQARNDSNSLVTLRKGTSLGTVVEYEVDGCFHAHPDIVLLAATSNTRKRDPIRDALATATVTTIEESTNQPTRTPETCLSNGVTIYGSESPADFRAIIEEFPNRWTDNGSAVDVPKDQRMEIPLLEN